MTSGDRARPGSSTRATSTPDLRPEPAFRHDALLYAGLDDFLTGSVAFVADGLANGEAVLVAVGSTKIEALRHALGDDAGSVMFVDISRLGRNPACIIPAWDRFVAEHVDVGRPARGIGEPVWRGRTPSELAECHRHELLLNLAFAHSPAWWLLCPYDTTTLGPELLEDAGSTHPHLHRAHQRSTSEQFPGVGALPSPFEGTLADPTGSVITESAFGAGPLDDIRGLVSRRAGFGGLSPDRAPKRDQRRDEEENWTV